MESEQVPREFEDVRITVPWGFVTGRWYGNRQVRPILALHGWLDNLGTWDTLIPLLPTHIGILCIDLPGHGKSSKLPLGIRYHDFDYVYIIMRVIKEYKWKKVSLLGHSMGSLIAFFYASLYPHMVDLLIAIDVIKPVLNSPEYTIERLTINIEKTIIEDERLEKMAMNEPPSYTYEELEQALFKGAYQSVPIENCKYLLNRSITKSSKYPDKYYFSRDGKLKIYQRFVPSQDFSEDMARRIKNVSYLVIKGSQSGYIAEDSLSIIEILRENNPNFEMHVVEGTHHVHLNNPVGVAAVLSPYISRHRPMTLNSWALDDDSTKEWKNDQEKRKDYARKPKNRVRFWSRSKL